jgi:hypothetical protein
MRWMPYSVDLVHDSLEAGQDGSQEDAAESEGGLMIVPHGEKVVGGIRAGDNDYLLTGLDLFIAAGRIVGREIRGVDFLLADAGRRNLVLGVGRLGRLDGRHVVGL